MVRLDREEMHGPRPRFSPSGRYLRHQRPQGQKAIHALLCHWTRLFQTATTLLDPLKKYRVAEPQQWHEHGRRVVGGRFPDARSPYAS